MKKTIDDIYNMGREELKAVLSDMLNNGSLPGGKLTAYNLLDRELSSGALHAGYKMVANYLNKKENDA